MTTPPEGEEFAHMDHVDRDTRVHEPTEPDEETVLRALYGEPDVDGVFRGEEVSPGG
ncbi:hypothetical protein [Thermomonospora umbrina]|uniref:Uncharacterized protein n=1 Tax=Thermomonospora umbrina TaxID=111806 RepID=A0A3D9T949_9ACTN|nr:hypothetical protein [Thermomonospora umbrina]REF00282.1 hypothetical protein DFJ69_5811 [Thermomonospora umbrina]